MQCTIRKRSNPYSKSKGNRVVHYLVSPYALLSDFFSKPQAHVRDFLFLNPNTEPNTSQASIERKKTHIHTLAQNLKKKELVCIFRQK